LAVGLAESSGCLARRSGEACTITRMTASGTPAVLRSASSVGEVSNSQVDDFILATITSDERPALTIVRTSLLVRAPKVDGDCRPTVCSPQRSAASDPYMLRLTAGLQKSRTTPSANVAFPIGKPPGATTDSNPQTRDIHEVLLRLS